MEEITRSVSVPRLPGEQVDIVKLCGQHLLIYSALE